MEQNYFKRKKEGGEKKKYSDDQNFKYFCISNEVPKSLSRRFA